MNPRPGNEVLNARVSCIRPDDSRQVAVGKVVGRSGLLKIPLTIAAPGGYRFEWMLSDRSDATLVAGSRELTLEKYVNDRALAQRAVLALQNAMGTKNTSPNGTDLVAAMQQEALAIEDEARALAPLQAAVPGSAPAFSAKIDGRTAALNARAMRALALANVAALIRGNAPGSKVVAFKGTMWENRDVNMQLPSEMAIPLQIIRRCVPGERESVSIKLLNVTLDAATVGVRVKPESNGPAVTVYEVKPVETNQGAIAWDPIVPLNGGTIAIPSLETREIWLDIDLAGVEAGTHRIEIVFDADANETKAEISLNVLPFEMAGPGAMRLCCWARYDGGAVEDLLAHGNNVFTANLPPVTVTEGKPPKIDVDFTILDRFIAPFSGHNVALLMGGIPSLGVPMESEAYVPPPR